jgi:hypothetical protein
MQKFDVLVPGHGAIGYYVKLLRDASKRRLRELLVAGRQKTRRCLEVDVSDQ